MKEHFRLTGNKHEGLFKDFTFKTDNYSNRSLCVLSDCSSFNLVIMSYTINSSVSGL